LEYDPSVTDYRQLLAMFWAGHDPTVPGYSRQYMSAVFAHDDEQLCLAKESMAAAQGNFKKEINTEIVLAGPFYQAEECVRKSLNLENVPLSSYHQKYILQKHQQLMKSLKMTRGQLLVSSSLAARLNGYLGGYGSKVPYKECQ